MYQESFAFYLSILRKQFVSYCTEKLSDLGITYNQLFVLIYISKKKDCFPKEIAEYLNLDAGQLNRTLAKLSEKELITQQKSQKDKRFQLLNITDKGFEMVEQSKAFFHQWDRQILSALQPDSQQELLNLMKQILLSQKENIGGTKMNTIHTFIQLLVGHFDNQEQFERKKQTDENFPYAKHINTVCNNKITNLPADFAGIFVLEESYYTAKNNTHATPHLFLFTQEQDGIKLTSYEIPEGYDKNTFTYQNLQSIDYTQLKISEKFTPALYFEKNGVWEGGSTSMFSPVLKFTLFERFSKECLEVTETMEVNGKKTFGYDEPILYKRILEKN